MINRRYAAPPPALGGSHKSITIGKTGERVVMSHVLENGHESVPLDPMSVS
jgi:hypothetical protein